MVGSCFAVGPCQLLAVWERDCIMMVQLWVMVYCGLLLQHASWWQWDCASADRFGEGEVHRCAGTSMLLRLASCLQDIFPKIAPACSGQQIMHEARHDSDTHVLRYSIRP